MQCCIVRHACIRRPLACDSRTEYLCCRSSLRTWKALRYPHQQNMEAHRCTYSSTHLHILHPRADCKQLVRRNDALSIWRACIQQGRRVISSGPLLNGDDVSVMQCQTCCLHAPQVHNRPGGGPGRDATWLACSRRKWRDRCNTSIVWGQN